MDAFAAPGFGIRAGSNIMTPFGLIYSKRKMYERFQIVAKVKPADDQVSKSTDFMENSDLNIDIIIIIISSISLLF